ncbi:phage portal protein [Kitasatospora sp. MBT63]|uniref:phage portal protein n=1 Tax=Kitasatospora sp. MBT63 TaxID=1444768 RepID=UPI0006924982|nr:phage portal protein [Kitasatospora sp. MBT63]
MGLIRSAARAAAGPSSGLATPERWVEDWFAGGASSAAGVRVSYETAMYYSPFFAGVRVIAEDVGSLPLQLYERLDPRGKQRARSHPLYEVLRYKANPMMTSQQLRETLQGHAITWGNGVAQIVTNPRTGVIEEVWPLRPDRLRICARWTGPGRFERVFQYRDDVNGIKATLLQDEVLHVAGLGFDGVRGYPIVEFAANSIGLGLATETHGSKVFSNGSAPGGALSHPGVLSPEARSRMAADWENIHKSINNAHRVAILEEGVTWQAVGMPNDSAQFLETRKLQVTEMARWLRLPSHKINDLERATFSNIEQQQLDYVASALRTWLERWEQAIYTQLLTTSERQRYFAEHLVDALLRGDTLARYQAYAVGRQWGWLSANDVREKENQNPVEGGDAYLVPLNMVPADQPQTPAAEPSRTAARARARRSAAARRKIAAAFAPKIEAADAALVELEAKKVTALAAKHLPATDGTDRSRSVSAFLAAVTTFYENTVSSETISSWLPIFSLLAADIATDAAEDVAHDGDIDLSTWVASYTKAHTAYRVASSIGQLRAAVDGAPDDPAAAVAERLAKWAAERPEQLSKWQTAQLPNAAAREAWKDAGVKRLQWITSGSSDCPFCDRMDGRTIAIDKPFIAAGGKVTGDGEGEDRPKLDVHRDTFHPPLHPGCDCQVLPE